MHLVLQASFQGHDEAEYWSWTRLIANVPVVWRDFEQCGNTTGLYGWWTQSPGKDFLPGSDIIHWGHELLQGVHDQRSHNSIQWGWKTGRDNHIDDTIHFYWFEEGLHQWRQARHQWLVQTVGWGRGSIKQVGTRSIVWENQMILDRRQSIRRCGLSWWGLSKVMQCQSSRQWMHGRSCKNRGMSMFL